MPFNEAAEPNLSLEGASHPPLRHLEASLSNRPTSDVGRKPISSPSTCPSGSLANCRQLVIEPKPIDHDYAVQRRAMPKQPYFIPYEQSNSYPNTGDNPCSRTYMKPQRRLRLLPGYSFYHLPNQPRLATSEFADNPVYPPDEQQR